MGDPKHQNNVRQLREAQLMSKAELARKAGLSPLTIDRVESGKPCRMDTKRKIILALGYKLADRHRVFPEDTAAASSSPRRAKKEREAAAPEAAPSGETDPSASAASEEAPRTAGTPPSEPGDAPRESRDETPSEDAPTESPDRAKAR